MKYLFEIKTIECQEFIKMFDTLKKIFNEDDMNEGFLMIDQKGLKVIDEDNGNIIDRLCFSNDRFFSFYCPFEYALQLNLNYFLKLLSMLSTHDKLTLYLPYDSNKMTIKCEDTNKGKIDIFKINVKIYSR